MKHITPTSSRRRFQAVAESIRQFIKEKGLSDGDQLPTERDLSRKLGVAVLTVRRAHQELEALGMIRREWGRGTFVGSSQAGSSLARRGHGALNVGYLSIRGELSGPTLDHFTSLRSRLADLGHHLVFELVQPHVDRNDLSQWVQRQGIHAAVAQGFLDTSIMGVLKRLNIPVVIAGNAPPFDGLPVAAPDLAEFSSQVVQRLHEDMGFDHVWLVIEPLRLQMSHLLLQGYRRAVQSLPGMIELVSLCEDNDPRPFVESFRLLQPKLGGRHAIFWTYPFPFVPVENFASPKREPTWGVVNYGRRLRGWFLPRQHDLGELPDPAGEYTVATFELIRDVLTNPSGVIADRVIVPDLKMIGDGKSRKLEVTWHPRDLVAQPV